MIKRLSPVQKSVLKSALRVDDIGGRSRYRSRDDLTMRILAARGFARWSPKHDKYGRDSWYITDEGIAEARRLFPLDAEIYDRHVIE